MIYIGTSPLSVIREVNERVEAGVRALGLGLEDEEEAVAIITTTCRSPSFGFRVQGSGFRVQGFGFRV